jgi:hypothetical protein
MEMGKRATAHYEGVGMLLHPAPYPGPVLNSLLKEQEAECAVRALIDKAKK